MFGGNAGRMKDIRLCQDCFYWDCPTEIECRECVRDNKQRYWMRKCPVGCIRIIREEKYEGART